MVEAVQARTVRRDVELGHEQPAHALDLVGVHAVVVELGLHHVLDELGQQPVGELQRHRHEQLLVGHIEAVGRVEPLDDAHDLRRL